MGAGKGGRRRGGGRRKAAPWAPRLIRTQHAVSTPRLLCASCPAHANSFEAIPGDYSELLASSIFCLYLPGDGWSARMEDAMLHGCAPGWRCSVGGARSVPLVAVAPVFTQLHTSRCPA